MRQAFGPKMVLERQFALQRWAKDIFCFLPIAYVLMILLQNTNTELVISLHQFVASTKKSLLLVRKIISQVLDAQLIKAYLDSEKVAASNN